MSGRNTISFQRFVENRHKSEQRRDDVPPLRAYSAEWKNICLRILKEYREYERKRFGRKKFGWLAARDAIMAKYDAKSGRKLAGRSRYLSQGHLEDWERHGTISDAAFRFVDAFVRSLQFSNEYRTLLSDAKRHQDRELARAFASVYQRRLVREGLIEYLSTVSGRFLYTGVVESAVYRHVVIMLEFPESGILKFVCAYCNFDIEKRDHRDLAGILFYEGFLIPVPHKSADRKPSDLPFRTDSWTCWVKMFRPQLKGSVIDGCADARIEYNFVELSPESVSIAINITNPTSLLAPSVGFYLRNSEASEASATKVRLANDQRNAAFLEKIFSECYKGYFI